MAHDEKNFHLEANGDVFLLRERMGDEFGAQIGGWYSDLGGDAFFDRLGETFYELVEQDEELAALFQGQWSTHARRLSNHFKRMYGQQQLDEAWDPHLLRVHTHVLISHEHRRRWLALFREAGTRLDASEPAFTELVSVMVIAASGMMAASRGAALTRGETFDKSGQRL